jgi:hypothetical protein
MLKLRDAQWFQFFLSLRCTRMIFSSLFTSSKNRRELNCNRAHERCRLWTSGVQCLSTVMVPYAYVKMTIATPCEAHRGFSERPGLNSLGPLLWFVLLPLDSRQRITFSAYFDPFNGPNQRKLLFESNLPISAIQYVSCPLTVPSSEGRSRKILSITVESLIWKKHSSSRFLLACFTSCGVKLDTTTARQS